MVRTKNLANTNSNDLKPQAYNKGSLMDPDHFDVRSGSQYEFRGALAGGESVIKRW